MYEKDIKEINKNIKNLLNYLNSHDHYFKELDRMKILLEELRINLNDNIDARIESAFSKKIEQINHISTKLDTRFNTFVTIQEKNIQNLVGRLNDQKKEFKIDLLDKISIINALQEQKIKFLEEKIKETIKEHKGNKLNIKHVFLKTLIGFGTTFAIFTIIFIIDHIFKFGIVEFILALN